MIGLLVGSLLLTPVSATVTDNLSIKIQGAIQVLRLRVTKLEADVNSCFQSASNGKALIAGYLTEKGVATSDDAAYSEIKDNVEELVNKQFKEGKQYGETHSYVTVSWDEPIASIGHYVEDIDLPDCTSLDTLYCKQVLYMDPDGVVKTANPYEPGCIKVKFNTVVYLRGYCEMYGEWTDPLIMNYTSNSPGYLNKLYLRRGTAHDEYGGLINDVSIVLESDRMEQQYGGNYVNRWHIKCSYEYRPAEF